MSDQALEEQQPADGVTAGQILRAAREAAGMHVASLAVSLKVPVRKLEALEQDRYDELPDAVFARGLASSVCRTLKIDPNPVLERLPRGNRPRLLQQSDGINTPFKPSGDVQRASVMPYISRPVLYTVVALLIGAVALVIMPPTQREAEIVAAISGSTAAPSAPAAAPAQTQAPMAPAGAEPAAAPPPPQALAPATLQPSMQVASAPMAAVPAAPPPAPAASAAVGGLVVFRTTGESWISVTDASGRHVMRKLLGPGDSEGVSGTLPLSVTVGNVRTTEVQVRGQPFDLGSHARDNVARFSVN